MQYADEFRILKLRVSPSLILLFLNDLILWTALDRDETDTMSLSGTNRVSPFSLKISMDSAVLVTS
jgi:hypothetical protein